MDDDFDNNGKFIRNSRVTAGGDAFELRYDKSESGNVSQLFIFSDTGGESVASVHVDHGMMCVNVGVTREEVLSMITVLTNIYNETEEENE